MEENSIKESIGRYNPDLNPERGTGEFIRNKNPDHRTPFKQGEEELKASAAIEDAIIDCDFYNRLENCSIGGEIVSTTADLLSFS
jgi:hypothetical protein